MITKAGIVAIVTCPGIVVHEWAHKKFCDLLGVKVCEVSYFNYRTLFAARTGPLGYVIYAEPKQFSHTFWISIGPLIVNSILATVLGYVASQIARGLLAQLTFFWVAISIGVHSFPSNQDARTVLQRSQKQITKNKSILHYLSYLFFGFICLANGLRRWWLDFFYAAALVTIGSRL